MTKEVRVKPLFSSAIIMLISVAYACKLLKNIFFLKSLRNIQEIMKGDQAIKHEKKLIKKKKNNMRHNQR